jgi:hypothetical protein
MIGCAEGALVVVRSRAKAGSLRHQVVSCRGSASIGRMRRPRQDERVHGDHDRLA